jgi:hypothetical protein
MKKFLLLCAMLMASAVVSVAQVTNITVETFYTDNGTVTGYPAGHTTYRIYANCTNPGDVVASVYGISDSPLSLQVSGGIWNSAQGGSTADNLSCALIGFAPVVQYDSYVSLSKTCDTSEPGSVRTVPTETSSWLDPFFGSTTAVPYGGNSFSINSASGSSWFALPGLDANCLAGPDLRVMLAQITTNGSVCGTFNLTVFPNYSGPNSPLLEQTSLSFGTATCGDPGCTDNAALNFDPNADYDNGLCLYPCDLAFTVNNPTNPSCGGLTDGSVVFQATGSQDLVSYTFDGSTPFLGNAPVTRNNLGNGTYVITARDTRFDNPLFNTDPDLTCEAEITVELNTVPLLVGDVSTTDVSCAGLSDGCALSSSTGGTGTITWEVLNNSNDVVQGDLPSADFCGLSAGTYTFRATDESGCQTSSSSYSITSPFAINMSSGSSTAASCPDSEDGVRVIVWSGGTGDVDFSLADDGTFELEGGPANVIITTMPGAYTIYAQDAQGCTASLAFTVPGPAPIIITPSLELPSCPGDGDGSITVSANGGNGGFTYSLDGGTPQATDSFTGLSAATYVLTAIDGAGCVANLEVALNDPQAVGANVLASQISCFGLTDGSLVITGTGGAGPYEYSLNGGDAQTSGVFNGLSAGVYSVIVTDANGCVFAAEQGGEVIEPAALVATSNVENISCNGLNDGVISVSTTGGTSPFSYSLNGGPLTASNDFDGLDVGSYTVAVTDSEGCQVETSGAITEPAALVINGLTADPINDTPGGSSPYTVSGGTEPYDYSWTNSQGSEISTNQNLGPFTSTAQEGSYTLTVTDDNGCTVSQTITVTDIVELDNAIQVALNPNPTLGQFYIKMNGLTGEKVMYTITDAQGRVVLRKELGNVSGERNELVDATAIAAGIYTVNIVSGSASTTVKMIKQ